MGSVPFWKREIPSSTMQIFTACSLQSLAVLRVPLKFGSDYHRQ